MTHELLRWAAWITSALAICAVLVVGGRMAFGRTPSALPTRSDTRIAVALAALVVLGSCLSLASALA